MARQYRVGSRSRTGAEKAALVKPSGDAAGASSDARPEDWWDKARPFAEDSKTRLTGPAARRTRERTRRLNGDLATSTATPDAPGDDLSDALTAGFRKAVDAAIQEAFDAGLAVPGRVNGKPVERRPDGAIAEINDLAGWSPNTWKNRP